MSLSREWRQPNVVNHRVRIYELEWCSRCCYRRRNGAAEVAFDFPTWLTIMDSRQACCTDQRVRSS